ncbi:hypothetical protein [Marinobacter halotolerans]|uniref:hypothetical protein n=1 Tax=Marinobacter halotolerans TaxID=1569211 RepID=UPI0012482832|nr:hypothetical protein [Marinobacter halotolerans]
MKKTASLAVVLALFSVTSWAQETNLDTRNKHIFCSAHLTVVGATLDEDNNERRALAYLSDMHREEATALGATGKHFTDVAEYLKKVRSSDENKWARLSNQARIVCLPGSDGAGEGQQGS